MAELLQCAQTPQLTLLLGQWSRRGARRRSRRFQTHASDIEVFLEAIGLQQIGEFERADVTPALTDFTLEVSDDPAQVLQGKARPQPLIPLPFPVKAQTQALTG